MNRHFTFFLLAGLLLTSACSEPSAFVPMASESELRAEQARFEQAVRSGPVLAKIEGEVPVTEEMKSRLDGIAQRVMPPAETFCREIYSGDTERQCAYDLVLTNREGVNAYADGEKVFVTSSMMQMASNDNHLAFVLSHELAHNMMNHPSRVGRNVMGGSLLGTVLDVGAAAAGISTGGAFGQLGQQATLLSYSPSFELEADYIGLYILERAGYEIEQAPNFWRAMAQQNPENIYNSTTHPTNPERFVVMNKTINEINSKKRLGFELMPEFKTDEHKRAGIF